MKRERERQTDNCRGKTSYLFRTENKVKILKYTLTADTSYVIG
jgi:hypothetical protein